MLDRADRAKIDRTFAYLEPSLCCYPRVKASALALVGRQASFNLYVCKSFTVCPLGLKTHPE